MEISNEILELWPSPVLKCAVGILDADDIDPFYMIFAFCDP